MIPFSGIANGIEPLLYVAASVVTALYTYQVFLPKLRQVLGAEPNYEKRAAALLQRYRQEQMAQHGRRETDHPEKSH